DRPEPADLMLGRDRTLCPWIRCARAAVVNERQPLPFGVFEIDNTPAIALDDLAGDGVVLLEMLDPPFERRFAAHAQAGARDAVRAAPFAWQIEVEKREIRSRRRFAIGVEKMVSRHVVLVDAFLNQPHAKRAGVEVLVALDIRADGGEMMDSEELHG